MIISYAIPNKYFQHGKPVITDYLGAKGEGLMYRVSLEESIEMGGNHLVVSLLSPYIRGFDSPYDADQLKVIDVDLANRKVHVEIIEKGA